MDLIYTLLFIVVTYYVYYKVIKPHFLVGGTVRSKINNQPDVEDVDYEEVE